MESSGGERVGRAWRLPSVEVTVAVVILVLALSYGVLFSRLVLDSLTEQHLAPHPHPIPRYMGPIHYHSPLEWVLLAVPAAVAWLGTVTCLTYLIRRRA